MSEASSGYSLCCNCLPLVIMQPRSLPLHIACVPSQYTMTKYRCCLLTVRAAEIFYLQVKNQYLFYVFDKANSSISIVVCENKLVLAQETVSIMRVFTSVASWLLLYWHCKMLFVTAVSQLMTQIFFMVWNNAKSSTLKVFITYIETCRRSGF